MCKISEEMDEIIGSAQEDKTDKTFEVKNLNSNQMVGSVLFQREISEKDSVHYFLMSKTILIQLKIISAL